MNAALAQQPVYDTPPGFYEWVEYLVATSSSPDEVIKQMIASGVTMDYARQYMSSFVVGKCSGSSNGIVGKKKWSGSFSKESVTRLWERLVEIEHKSAVDLGDRTAYVIFKRPASGIFYLKNFLSDAECDALIAQSKGKTVDSYVVDHATGEQKPHEARTSKGLAFQRRPGGLIDAIEDRVARLLNQPTEFQEGIQILEYGPTNEYKPHHDFFDPVHGGHRMIISDGGQRMATVLMYLNDCFDAGETIFPELGIGLTPMKGCALVFPSCDHHGLLLDWSKHAGRPVGSGTKWVATKWIRSFEYKQTI